MKFIVMIYLYNLLLRYNLSMQFMWWFIYTIYCNDLLLQLYKIGLIEVILGVSHHNLIRVWKNEKPQQEILFWRLFFFFFFLNKQHILENVHILFVNSIWCIHIIKHKHCQNLPATRSLMMVSSRIHPKSCLFGVSDVTKRGNPPKLHLQEPASKTHRVNFKPPPAPPTPSIWKPPLYRERKALFRSDGVLQSAPVILQPTQTAKGSQQPIRCAGGGFLPAIPAKGIYYDDPSRGHGRREVREPNRVRIGGTGGGGEGPETSGCGAAGLQSWF